MNVNTNVPIEMSRKRQRLLLLIAHRSPDVVASFKIALGPTTGLHFAVQHGVAVTALPLSWGEQ
jgi:hypothetical protein